eukprot:ANDGO_00625.mRNA.1 hypothetical protein
MGRFHEGDHVQWTHRSGTRAGFIDNVFETPEDAKAAGARKMADDVSKDHPAYLISQEKQGLGTIVKLEDRLEKVDGDSGKSRDEIIHRDLDVKKEKRRGAKRASEAEPSANAAKKTRLSGRKGRRSASRKRDAASMGDV